MNIVQVNFLNDYSNKRYAFNVPDGIKLKKGQLVRVEIKRRNGHKEAVAECVTDSHVVTDEIVDMIMQGMKVISSVIGAYTLIKFDDEF